MINHSLVVQQVFCKFDCFYLSTGIVLKVEASQQFDMLRPVLSRLLSTQSLRSRASTVNNINQWQNQYYSVLQSLSNPTRGIVSIFPI